MRNKLIRFHVPRDEALLAALGEVAVRHEQMNYVLKLIIKNLNDMTTENALTATLHTGSKALRERIIKIARKRFGENATVENLLVMLRQCEELTQKRNELIHGLWTEELTGEARLRTHAGPTPPPTLRQLRSLANALHKQTLRLNYARKNGFLNQALTVEG